MDGVTETLVLDMVAWIAARPRPYAEVMEAWRSSCPRLTIWEDALDRRLVACERDGNRGVIVRATRRGRALLAEQGRLPEAAETPESNAA